MGRVKDRKDTWNATSNQWAFPQTPARVQISIWPGGLASNAQGTIDWAGGEIDWNGADIQTNGYYYAQFESVTVKCYSADSAPGTNKGKSYTYSSAAGTNDTVVDGNKATVLKSLLGTGTNMSADYANSAAASSAIAVIPGLTGAGPGTDGRQPEDSSSAAAAGATAAATQGVSGSGAGAGSVAATQEGAASTATGFDQGVAAAAATTARSGGAAVRGVVGGEGVWTAMSVVLAGLGMGVVGL